MTDLSAFPRPNVAADVAVLAVAPEGGLVTLLVTDEEGAAVPGRFLRPQETVAECIEVSLTDKAGLAARLPQPHLLRVFDDPERDPRGWTLSLGHYVTVRHRELAAESLRWAPVADLPALRFDHELIVAAAVTHLRTLYELHPDPARLLEAPFTLSELRDTHQHVLGEPVARDTFRRRMEPQLDPHVVDGVHESRSDGGRPARLWRHRDQSVPTASLGQALPRSRRR